MNPFTSPNSVGVLTRYLSVIITTVISVLGLMNWMTPEQVQEIKGMIPAFLEAFTAVVALGIPIYAAITKAMSERGLEVAKETDAKVPPDMPVIVKTPTGVADIKVPAKE